MEEHGRDKGWNKREKEEEKERREGREKRYKRIRSEVYSDIYWRGKENDLQRMEYCPV